MADEKETHPVTLYKPGETVNPEAWNEKIDHKIVQSDEVDEALADGWFKHPSDFPPEKPAKGK